MMGLFARSARLVAFGAACACNAISGADGLATDPAGDESSVVPSRNRHDPGSSSGDTSSSSSSSGAPTTAPDGGTTDSGGIGIAPSPDAPPIGGGTAFFDPFERPDGPAIGNGWTEKVDEFSLLGGAVRQTGIGSYRNQLVRRPAVEDALDVAISVHVTHDKVDGDPCLYARMQPASDTAGQLVSYTFYAYFDIAYLDRDDGSTGTELASKAISPPLPSGVKYSLSLKVTGTNPVVLVATVKNAAGTVVATLDAQDASAKRIATAGGVGFGSGDADGALFDDFRRVVP